MHFLIRFKPIVYKMNDNIKKFAGIISLVALSGFFLFIVITLIKGYIEIFMNAPTIVIVVIVVSILSGILFILTREK